MNEGIETMNNEYYLSSLNSELFSVIVQMQYELLDLRYNFDKLSTHELIKIKKSTGLNLGSWIYKPCLVNKQLSDKVIQELKREVDIYLSEKIEKRLREDVENAGLGYDPEVFKNVY